jgi:mucin-19
MADLRDFTGKNRNDESDTTTTFTISGSNFSPTGLQAALFNNSGTEISFTTVTRVNDTTVTAVLTNSNLGAVDEPYDIKITNGSGLSNTFADQINVNEAPAWTTAAGSIGTLFDTNRGAAALTSSTLVATDPEGGDVDYYISSGTLPTGLSLDGETGVISGTADAVGSDTTYNFTITAHDTASNVTSRAFSITVKAPVITSFTTAGPATYNVPTGVTQVKVLVVGGGGSSGSIGGGGGAGGLVYHESFPVTPGGTVAYNVGTGAPQSGAHPDPGPNPDGNPSTFGSLTALGGESAAGWSSAPGGGTVGSGAGGPGTPGAGNIGGTADQPGQSNPGATHNAGFPGARGGSNGGANATTGAGQYTGGGGGGAGFAGGHPTRTGPGDTRNDAIAGRKGGDGLSINITGSATYYAGGGGGARHDGGYASPQATAVGGLGGGGSSTPASTGQAGTANTGGGGGAGYYTSGGNSAGGAGGSGIIIVRS